LKEKSSMSISIQRSINYFYMKMIFIFLGSIYIFSVIS